MKKLILFVIFVTSTVLYLKAQSSNKEIKFGGRIMYDMAAWETATGDEITNMTGVEFRRVRLFNSGKLFGHTKYKLQLDYAGGNISYKDVWIELVGLPMDGSFRVGHFKTISDHFFANYISIFHKTEVLTIILICLTCLKLNWIKSYDINHNLFRQLCFSILEEKKLKI